MINLKDEFGYGTLTNLGELLLKLRDVVFSIAAILVTFYLILGFFRLLRSAGNKEEVAGARTMITHALIAFLMLILMFPILGFLLGFFFGSGYNIF